MAETRQGRRRRRGGDDRVQLAFLIALLAFTLCLLKSATAAKVREMDASLLDEEAVLMEGLQHLPGLTPIAVLWV